MTKLKLSDSSKVFPLLFLLAYFADRVILFWRALSAKSTRNIFESQNIIARNLTFFLKSHTAQKIPVHSHHSRTTIIHCQRPECRNKTIIISRRSSSSTSSSRLHYTDTDYKSTWIPSGTDEQPHAPRAILLRSLLLCDWTVGSFLDRRQGKDQPHALRANF